MKAVKVTDTFIGNTARNHVKSYFYCRPTAALLLAVHRSGLASVSGRYCDERSLMEVTVGTTAEAALERQCQPTKPVLPQLSCAV